MASRKTGRANERGAPDMDADSYTPDVEADSYTLDADANSDMPGKWHAANGHSGSRGSDRSDVLRHDGDSYRNGANGRDRSGRGRGKYYRSSDGVLGGVCAGLADYYNADVLPFRLVFVLLAAASLGAFAVVYLICVLAWSKRDTSNAGNMYEVQPHRVDSTAYGSLSAADIRKMSTRGRHRRADAPRSVGHIPPIPPRCFVVQYGEIAPFFTQVNAPGVAGPGPGSGYAPQSPRDRADERRRMSNRAIYLVLAGLFLLTLLFDALATRFVEPSQPMQLLPLFFVLVGVCVLVVPSGRAYVPVRLADGCALIVGGMFALALSVGALSTDMLANPPIAVTLIALTALVLATLRKRPRWLLIVIGALTLLLAILVFAACTQPGPVSHLTLTLPLVGSANIWFR